MKSKRKFKNTLVQFSHSVVSDSLWPHELQHARPPCPSPTPGVYPNPCPSPMSVMPSNHLILCHPLLLLPSIFPSIRVFSNELALCIRWPKYWSFSFNISPTNEHPVHPKGDQSWVFIGRTDVEAETPILWPPDGKSWLIWKDPDAGKDWGQEEKGMTEDEMVGWHHRHGWWT